MFQQKVITALCFIELLVMLCNNKMFFLLSGFGVVFYVVMNHIDRENLIL